MKLFIKNLLIRSRSCRNIYPKFWQDLNKILWDLIHILDKNILQGVIQDLTQDLKVFFAKILETSCQQLIKNLAISSQDLIGINIQDLGKILRSYRILSIPLLNMILQDLVQDITQFLKVFLGKTLESSCQERIKNVAKSSQDLIEIYIQDLGKILIRYYRTLSILLLNMI